MYSFGTNTHGGRFAPLIYCIVTHMLLHDVDHWLLQFTEVVNFRLVLCTVDRYRINKYFLAFFEWASRALRFAVLISWTIKFQHLSFTW